jgi:hypothetical protein
MKKIASHYSSVDYSNTLITETLTSSRGKDIHPPIKKLMGKKEFLADLGYQFPTTSISNEYLSKNEALLSGLIYKKIWIDIGLNESKEWKEKIMRGNQILKAIATNFLLSSNLAMMNQSYF